MRLNTFVIFSEEINLIYKILQNWYCKTHNFIYNCLSNVKEALTTTDPRSWCTKKPFGYRVAHHGRSLTFCLQGYRKGPLTFQCTCWCCWDSATAAEGCRSSSAATEAAAPADWPAGSSASAPIGSFESSSASGWPAGWKRSFAAFCSAVFVKKQFSGA